MGRHGETQHGDDNNVVIERRGESTAYKSNVDQRLTLNFFQASSHPNTHNSHRVPTVEDNQFGVGNAESDVEKEGDWHDDVMPKDPVRQPTRFSEAMVIEVRSAQLGYSSLRHFLL